MKICIPICEKNEKEAIKMIKVAGKHADFIEIWLDKIPVRSVVRLIKLARKPVIAVCKNAEEHGSFIGTENERVSMLECAIKNGAKYIDVGVQTSPQHIKNLKKVCKKFGAKLIVSKHFWDHTPEIGILEKAYKRAKNLCADIIKIVTYAREYSDNVVLFEFVTRINSNGGNKKIICHAMGERGKISRLGCGVLGSFLTYIALDEKSKTADGQLVIDEFFGINL